MFTGAGAEDAAPFGSLAIRGRSGAIEVFALKER